MPRVKLSDKEKAMAVLQSRLWEIAHQADVDAHNNERKSQVGTGDRSEKIRTYNYPQSRVTDHRINKTIFNLDGFLNGNVDVIIDDLIALDTAMRLKGEENGN